MSQIIVGIDPGTRFAGFGAVEVSAQGPRHIRHGVIELSAKEDLSQRLLGLSNALAQLFSELKPNQVAVERVFLGKNPDSAFKLGHARGVCLQNVAQQGAELFEYAPRTIKKSVTGNGGASKEEVRLVTASLLKIKSIAAFDASDALALALCHCYHLQQEQTIRNAMRGAQL